MPDLWKRAPAGLPARKGNIRVIAGGPLLDLKELQRLVAQRVLGEDHLRVATPKCDRDLENYQWTYDDVLQMLGCMLEQDYRKSEWCQVRGGEEYPCDVYVFPYDETRRQRNRNGLEIYLKFSVDESGMLTLVLVSCHGSR